MQTLNVCLCQHLGESPRWPPSWPQDPTAPKEVDGKIEMIPRDAAQQLSRTQKQVYDNNLRVQAGNNAPQGFPTFVREGYDMTIIADGYSRTETGLFVQDFESGESAFENLAGTRLPPYRATRVQLHHPRMCRRGPAAPVRPAGHVQLHRVQRVRPRHRLLLPPGPARTDAPGQRRPHREQPGLATHSYSLWVAYPLRMLSYTRNFS